MFSATAQSSTLTSVQTTDGTSFTPTLTTSSEVTTDSSSGSTSSPSASLPSSTVNSTEGDNSTSTSSTTHSITTTQMVILCKNGTCAGNDSSCLNETITGTCMLSDSQSCYQIVYTNETDTYYEVGCYSTCEFLVEDTEDVTKTTRCCDTNMCNNELLSDPDPGNNAVKIPVPCYSMLLVLYLSRLFNQGQ
ncbi:uncharacterized protein LOC123563650 [Mercenaria mercenaria]|uniref:uncharacterized protein LOC123563650 n=1 Tax=Mercenaria mercenaria TaxID=6596 RepID=UPI00234F12C1|nr:uncharacterized protein LOC123563650 [Mercenaria mercenaria]